MHIRADDNNPVTAALDSVLRRRLVFAGLDLPATPLTLVGPFPSFTVDYGELIAGRTRSALRSTGWRGLLEVVDAPLAVVELSRLQGDSDRPDTPRSDRLRVAVRPGDEANAMYAALDFISDARADDSARYRLSWLTIPSLYMAGFMLDGPRRLYVPTRTGFGPRPAPGVVDSRGFRALVPRERQDRRHHVGRQRQIISKSAATALPMGG